MEFRKIEDVLEVAVRIERNAVEFYRIAASMAQEPAVKDIMNVLAAEEEKHIGVFRKILDNVADYKPRFSYPGEYESFISGVARRVISGGDKADEFLKAKDLRSALNSAISLEMDTIMFYNELALEFEDNRAKQVIKDIVEEEKAHWARLAGFKKASGKMNF